MTQNIEVLDTLVRVVNGEEKDEILKMFAEDESSREDVDDPFMVTHLGDILDKYKRWKRNFPRVELFYAVKVNADPTILRLLAQLGLGFDCASKNEIKEILSCSASPDRIIYSNPCKQTSHLKYGAAKGVKLTVVDNVEELYKISKFTPELDLLIRIKPVDGRKAVYKLCNKFGCTPEEVGILIEKAKDLNLNVVGVSFHVGSGCADSSAYAETIEQARAAFELGEKNGYIFSILDIGGGFPGDNDFTAFDNMSQVINEALDKYFPADSGVRIIAEPGRYFVASAVSLVVNVIGKQEKDGRVYYHINQGLTGALQVVKYEKILNMYPLWEKQNSKSGMSTVWGPALADVDCVAPDIELAEMNVGDWMVISVADMGAYFMDLATKFNGLPLPFPYYIIDQEHLSTLKEVTNET